MSDIIKPKRSNTPASQPALGDLVAGEIAINLADRLLYVRNDSSQIVSLDIADLDSFDTDDLSEGTTNLYYTDARARASVSGGTGVTVDGSGVISIGQSVATTADVTFNDVDVDGALTVVGSASASSFVGDLTGNVTGQVSTISNFDTDDLTEGTSNLYFTDERVDDRVNALLVAGTNITLTYDDGANTLTIASSAGAGSVALDDLTDVTITSPVDGALLAYDNGSSNWIDAGTFASQFSTQLAAADTDDLAEGTTNLYYNQSTTDALYVSLTGDTMTGGLVVDEANITIQRAATGTYNLLFNDDSGTLQSYISSTASNQLSINGSIVSGATLRNRLLLEDDGTIQLRQTTASATTYEAWMDYTTTTDLPNATSIVTRARGDARYLELTGGTVSGATTFEDTVVLTGGSLRLEEQNLYMDRASAGSTNIFFRDDSDTLQGYLVLTDTDQIALHGAIPSGGTERSRILMNPDGEVQLRQATTSTVYEAWMDYTTTTDLPSTASIVTRARGDARYLQSSGLTTDDITEGTTNLYYTDARAQAAFTSGTGVDITSGTISIGQAVDTTDDVTFANLILSGNLTVNGTTTTINSNTLEIGDNTIVLNIDETGTPSQDAGIEIERGTLSNVSLLWDETNDRWTVGTEDFVASTFIGDLTGDVTGTVSSISNFDTDNLAEGTTNLYYTTGRFDTAFSGKTTDDLAEGTTNLYYDQTTTDGLYVSLTGDTMTGSLILDSAALEINENHIYLDKASSGSAYIYFRDNSDTVQNYIASTGTHQLTVTGIDAGGGVPARLLIDDDGKIQLRQSTASTNYQAWLDYTTATDLPSTTSIVTRARGDDRYLQLTGGTLTGALAIGGSLNVNSANLIVNDGSIYVDNDSGASSVSIFFRNSSGGQSGRIQSSNGGDTSLHSAIVSGTTSSKTARVVTLADGRVYVRSVDSSGDTNYDSYFDYTDSTSLPSSNSVVTRDRGDNRYLQLTDTTDDLTEGTTNLYYTDTRVQTYGDTRYQQLGGGVQNSSTSVTITTTNSNLVSVSTGTLTAGEIYEVCVVFELTKGATVGKTRMTTLKTSGTSAVTFDIGSDFRIRNDNHTGTGIWAGGQTSYMTVSTGGTCQMTVQGICTGSNATGSVSLRIRRIA